MDWGSIGKVLAAVGIVLAGIAAFLCTGRSPAVKRMNKPWPMILYIAGAAGFVLMVVGIMLAVKA